MNDYTLIQGDCLEIMPTLEKGSVDLVLCDPPYGTTACSWDTVIPFAPMWEAIRHVRKERAAVVLFGSEPFSSLLRVSNLGEYKYDWIAPKSYKTGFVHAKNKPLKGHDNISVFSFGATIHKGQSSKRMIYNPQMGKGEPYKKKQVSIGKNRYLHKPSKSNIDFLGTVSINNGTRYPEMILPVFRQYNHVYHPTQKPVALLEYLIKTYTLPGQTVLDFTMGSGSTGVACAKTGRKFRGIENSPIYFPIAETRIKNAYGEFVLTDEEKETGQLSLF